ncbi:helix-turn-helix domain-containing protein [Patescibacteria group bacterium]|nr:helix-turn-helix domain-containing protein [Patescibacteria group bacterium]
MNKRILSTVEVAKILGISRQAVLKKIQTGDIKAEKQGRNFVINSGHVSEILGKVLTSKRKKEIERAVDKTIREYGQTLKLLGQE